MKVRKSASGLIFALVMLGSAGCDHIHDPWVSAGEDVGEERERSEALDEALDERALNQAGPAGPAEATDYESSRFIEK